MFPRQGSGGRKLSGTSPNLFHELSFRLIDVLTAIEVAVFWDVTPYNLVDRYQYRASWLKR
jgi:hypothetical protein